MNTSQRLAVTRYAAAYDALSVTNEEASRRADMLAQAAEALGQLKELLADPVIPLTQKKQAIRAGLVQQPQVSAFIEVLLEAKRYDLLPQIVRQVQELLDKRLGIVRARVVSAGVLFAQQQTQVVSALESRYGKKIHAFFETNSALLGGLKIWCCGELIDGSIQGELARLQEELTK